MQSYREGNSSSETAVPLLDDAKRQAAREQRMEKAKLDDAHARGADMLVAAGTDKDKVFQQQHRKCKIVKGHWLI